VETGGPVPDAGSSTSTRACGSTPSTPPYPAEIWLDAYAHTTLIWSIIRRLGISDRSGEIDAGELFSAGLEGAVGALMTWDPAAGKAKSNWIYSRVQGAVRDEMRRQGSRNGWSRHKGRVFRVLSLEQLLEGHLEDGVPPSPTPAELLEEPTWYEGDGPSFDELVGHLTGRERAVIELRFRYGLTLGQIGRRFGVTESRISQIVGAVCRKLRAELEEVS